MPFSNIDKPSKYFDTKLYTGTGSTQSITGLEFAPKFTWVKNRTSASGSALFDIIRGAGYRITSTGTDAEVNNTAYFTAFNSDGFSVALAGGETNVNGNNYATWNWRASDSSAVTNTAGSITSTVSANTTAGFSVVSYTSQSSGSATIGHGLGAVPKMIICKIKDQSDNWRVYHSSLGNTGFMILNLTNAFSTNSTTWNNTSPTSTVFTLGTQWAASYNMITYCFAEVKGYSKFGSYTGNGNANGTFIYTGFKPSFIMVRRTDSAGFDWAMMDNKRDTYNEIYKTLWANLSNAEYTTTGSSGMATDLLSNGFKIRGTNGENNASGGNYIYMAFAENPFCSSKGIPTTAR